MAKEKKQSDPQEKLAGYLYDISKLTFAALVLGAFTPLLSGNGIDWKIPVGGTLFTFFFALSAHKLMKGK